MKPNSLTILFGMFAAPCASAAVLGITSSVTSPTLSTIATMETTTNVILQGFSVGSTSYTDLTFLAATAVPNLAQPFQPVGAGSPTSNHLPTAIALLSDNSLSTGVANTRASFSLGGEQNEADSAVFFMYELVLSTDPSDAINVYALDSMGVRIQEGGSDRTIAIGSSDYGSTAGFFRVGLLGDGNLSARGVTFQLSDFSGTGALDGVYGLEFSPSTGTSTGWDPLAAGIAAVPEPSSLLLGALSLLGLATRRRR